MTRPRSTRATLGLLVLAAGLLFGSHVRAEEEAAKSEESTEELTKKTQNPVADLISVPFQSNFNFGAGPRHALLYVLNVQPVVPIKLTEDWNLITRTIVPIISQGSLAPGIDHVGGLGDINPSLSLSPSKPGKARGSTARSRAISGRSPAGGKSEVNQGLVQPFLNYNFGKGWYLTSAPIVTANWTAQARNQWTVPVGGGGGKLWRVGKVGPVNTQIQAFYRERGGDMKRRTIAIALCAGVLASCAAKKPEPRPEPVAPARAATPPPALPSGTVGQETLTATATVVNVNLKTRHVTQKDADGKKFTIVAGPEVRNLAQVKKGDVLRVRYRESIAYQVSKPGQAQPGASASRDVSRAPLGAKPAGSVTNTVSVRATIAAIDEAHSEATLRGPQGKTTVVKVKDPSKLDAVQVGDRRCHLHRGACHRGREGRREIALRPRGGFVQAAEGASTASVGSASAGRSS